MIATKDDLLNGAFDELRISGLTANPTPKERQSALLKMEEIAAEYESRNICINYLFEEAPNPSSSSGINIQFNQMMKTNLAVRLIPVFGKNSQQSPALIDLKNQASASLSNASARTAKVNEVNYPDRQPVGSGNNFRYGQKWRRYYHPKPDAPISCSTNDLQLNTVKDYIESWSDFLAAGETITSYIISSTNGLQTTNDQINTGDESISYRAKGLLCGWQNITISIVTTNSTPDFADVRTVNFNVIDNLS